jgi:hypothetical protein
MSRIESTGSSHYSAPVPSSREASRPAPAQPAITPSAGWSAASRPANTASADRPVRGPVTDTLAFANFIATRPTEEQFKSKYPDVVLVMPGQLATMDFKGRGERFQARTDADGRIIGGNLEEVGNIGVTAAPAVQDAGKTAPSARVVEAARMAEDFVSFAKNNLHAPWPDATRRAMRDLFGKGSLSDAETSRIEQRLDAVIAKIHEIADGTRQPSSPLDARDGMSLMKQIIEDSVRASGAHDLWNVEASETGFRNVDPDADDPVDEEIDHDDIVFSAALQNADTLINAIFTLR